MPATLEAVLPRSFAVGTHVCPFCGTTLFGYEVCGCEGQKQASYRAASERKAASERCVAQAHERICKRSGVAPRFLRSETQPVADLIFRQLKGGSSGFCLWGPSGSGKSSLLSQIAVLWIRDHLKTILHPQNQSVISAVEGEACQLVSCDRLLDTISSSWKSKDQDLDPLEEAGSVPLLLLDDLGSERVSEWSVACLCRLIDARYANDLPLIIACRKDLSEVGQRWAKAADVCDVEAALHKIQAMCQPIELEKRF